MKKVIFLAVLAFGVWSSATAQSIVPEEVVQVGENVAEDAVGWQAFQKASTLLYLPFGGAFLSLGVINLIQFITETEQPKPIPKLIVGITCIIAAGAAVGFGAATSNTW